MANTFGNITLQEGSSFTGGIANSDLDMNGYDILGLISLVGAVGPQMTFIDGTDWYGSAAQILEFADSAGDSFLQLSCSAANEIAFLGQNKAGSGPAFLNFATTTDWNYGAGSKWADFYLNAGSFGVPDTSIVFELADDADEHYSLLHPTAAQTEFRTGGVTDLIVELTKAGVFSVIHDSETDYELKWETASGKVTSTASYDNPGTTEEASVVSVSEATAASVANRALTMVAQSDTAYATDSRDLMSKSTTGATLTSVGDTLQTGPAFASYARTINGPAGVTSRVNHQPGSWQFQTPTLTPRVTINSAGITLVGELTVGGEDQVAKLEGVKHVPINSQVASYQLVAADDGALVEVNNALANTLTIPNNATVPFTVGTQIRVRQTGAGQTTMLAGGGVTLQSPGGLLAISAQYGLVTLIKVATDTWSVSGDLV